MTTPASMDLSGLIPTLRDELPAIVTEVVELLGVDRPEYAAVLADDPDIYGLAEVALVSLIRLAERMPRQRDRDTEDAPSAGLGSGSAFEEIGRTEQREGHSLDELLSAYRAGARVAWRRLSARAVALGIGPEPLARLAEAVFVYVEELSSASARGYVDEQRASASERERLRSELGELLLSARADSALVLSTALQAAWPVPATAALVLIEPGGDVGALLSRLDAGCLPVRHGGVLGAIVADPAAPGRRTAMSRALAGLGAVVGTPVTLADLPASVRVTEAALRLRHTGALVDDPVFVEDHYDVLVVARDPWLLDRLRDHVLAPLAAVPDGTRERLEETLAAWLAAMGDRRATAQALRVHPQTVRYRLKQLEDLFGDALRDPTARLKLTLATCWRRPEEPRSSPTRPVARRVAPDTP